MQIEAAKFSSCTATAEGQRIALCFRDADNNAVEVRFSAVDASALAVTLPHALQAVLRDRLSEDGLQHVYPLDFWQIDHASDGNTITLTLAAEGGFVASFAVPLEACPALGAALAEEDTARHAELPQHAN